MTLARSLYSKIPLELRDRIRPLKYARVVFDGPPEAPAVDRLWSTEPVSRQYGFDRGTPIDRYYIERFLDRYASDIRGRVLEVQDNDYTIRYGGTRVTKSDVLHAEPGHPGATLVADLCDAPAIESASFDCIILTQTLSFIPDLAMAASTLARILKPGGTLLLTTAGISRICRVEDERWGHYWNLTHRSLEHILAGPFAGGSIEIESFGNVLSAICSLQGLAAEELHEGELDLVDPDYAVIVAARVVKARPEHDH